MPRSRVPRRRCAWRGTRRCGSTLGRSRHHQSALCAADRDLEAARQDARAARERNAARERARRERAIARDAARRGRRCTASTRAPTRRRLKRAFAAVVTLPVTTTLPAISLLRRQTTPWVVARVRLKAVGGIGAGGAGVDVHGRRRRSGAERTVRRSEHQRIDAAECDVAGVGDRARRLVDGAERALGWRRGNRPQERVAVGVGARERTAPAMPATTDTDEALQVGGNSRWRVVARVAPPTYT